MTKKQKAKNKKRPSVQSRSPIRSAVIRTVFDMTATAVTFAPVLLCLVMAKHFAQREAIMLVELFPVVASAMAVLCVIAIGAEDSGG
jgi:hypothetical protein